MLVTRKHLQTESSASLAFPGTTVLNGCLFCDLGMKFGSLVYDLHLPASEKKTSTQNSLVNTMLKWRKQQHTVADPAGEER